MKRAWDPDAATNKVNGSSEPWGLSSHPYASAYSSLSNPFQPSPLHNETSLDQYSNREPPIKRNRPGDLQSSLNEVDLGSEMGDDDDEEDEEDDGDDANSKTTGSAKKGKGGKGGDKGKVKLTRGSR